MWGVAALVRRGVAGGAAAAGVLRRSSAPRSLQLTQRRAFAEEPAWKQAVKAKAEGKAKAISKATTRAKAWARAKARAKAKA